MKSIKNLNIVISNNYKNLFLIFILLLIKYSPIINHERAHLWDSYEFTYINLLYFFDSIKNGIFPLWNPYNLTGISFVGYFGNTFIYSPILIIYSFLFQKLTIFYAFQLFLITTPFLGAVGFYLFLQTLLKNEMTSFFGSCLFSLVMFGNLLGSNSIAWSIVGLPWILYFFLKLYIEINNKTLLRRNIIYSGIILFFFAVGSYPFLFIMNVVVSSLFILYISYINDKSIINSVLLRSFALILIIFILLSSVFILPSIEYNRNIFENLLGDYIPIDGYFRTMKLKYNLSIDLLYYFNDIFSVLTGWYSSTQINWFSPVGISTLILVAMGLSFFLSNYIIKFWLIVFLFFSLYILGHKGLVFDFIYFYIPILNSNRYSIFGFYLVSFSLMMIASISFHEFFKAEYSVINLKLKRFKSVLMIAGFIFLYLSITKDIYFTIFWVMIVAISIFLGYYNFKEIDFYKKVLASIIIIEAMIITYPASVHTEPNNTVTINAKDFENKERNRVKKIGVDQNDRYHVSDFAHNSKREIDWVYTKKITNGGHNSAVNAIFTYISHFDFLKNIFYTTNLIYPQLNLKRKDYPSDNEYINNTVSQLKNHDYFNYTILSEIKEPINTHISSLDTQLVNFTHGVHAENGYSANSFLKSEKSDNGKVILKYIIAQEEKYKFTFSCSSEVENKIFIYLNSIKINEFNCNAKSFDKSKQIRYLETLSLAPGKNEIILEKTSSLVLYVSEINLISTNSKVTISNIKITPNQFSVTVKNPYPTLLVLTDLFYPGWEVKVNNKKSKLLKANLIYKAVFLEAGENNVIFDYIPLYFYIGASITSIVFILLFGFLVYNYKKK